MGVPRARAGARAWKANLYNKTGHAHRDLRCNSQHTPRGRGRGARLLQDRPTGGPRVGSDMRASTPLGRNRVAREHTTTLLKPRGAVAERAETVRQGRSGVRTHVHSARPRRSGMTLACASVRSTGVEPNVCTLHSESTEWQLSCAARRSELLEWHDIPL